MAAHYHNVTIQEMRDLLKADKGWLEQSVFPYGFKTDEVVFNYHLPKQPHLVVKVYTGIRKDSGFSRTRGRDAIRVCAVNEYTNQGWIKAKRVHRVEGWRENLKDRVTQVIRQSRARA